MNPPGGTKRQTRKPYPILFNRHTNLARLLQLSYYILPFSLLETLQNLIGCEATIIYPTNRSWEPEEEVHVETEAAATAAAKLGSQFHIWWPKNLLCLWEVTSGGSVENLSLSSWSKIMAEKYVVGARCGQICLFYLMVVPRMSVKTLATLPEGTAMLAAAVAWECLVCCTENQFRKRRQNYLVRRGHSF